jgi:cysteine-rich repeat protein
MSSAVGGGATSSSVAGGTGGAPATSTVVATSSSGIGGSVASSSSGAGSICGNGVLEPGEVCDPGPNDPCGTCDTTCTASGAGPVCGDGIVCAGVEACDDGNTLGGDFCSSGCELAGYCGTDTLVLSGSGFVDTGSARAMIPLCDGKVLLGDRTINALVILDAIGGKVEKTYPLKSGPRAIGLDPSHSTVLVGEAPASFVERIDLVTGAQTSIPVPAGVVGLTLANDGMFFATLEDTATHPNRPMALINGITGAIEQTYLDTYGMLVAYERAGNQLFTGAPGLPYTLRRDAFDPLSKTLTPTQSFSNIGEGCRDVAISPDGKHLAYSCGSGNGPGNLTTYDFSASDLTVVYGAFQVGPFPRVGAFSPNGKYFAASNGKDVRTFSMATHLLVSTQMVDFSNCNIPQIAKLGFSPGGKFLYAFSNCDTDLGATGRLFWFAVDLP